jgi:hypothetical protein
MPRLAELRPGTAISAAGIDQFGGFQQSLAAVALIASGIVAAAMRQVPSTYRSGEKSFAARTISCSISFSLIYPCGIDILENTLDDFCLDGVGRPTETIE